MGTLSLTIWVYLHSFSYCCLPNLRNSQRIRTYSSSWSPKIIDLGVNWKHKCNFQLVINSNYGLSLTIFDKLTHLARKWLVYSSLPCLMPPNRGTPFNINVIHTLLKSTFNGLQFCHRHYGPIFIHLTVVASRNHEIMRNSDKIWPYNSSRSSIVMSIESSHATSY